MRALLDVNVLVALFDRDHVHHGLARGWLEGASASGWASCPITENGLVRVLSQPSYPRSVTTGAAMRLIADARAGRTHKFWPADVSLFDAVVPERVHSPSQITDLYLLALAVRHRGRLVTLDRRIPLSAVPGAREEHLVTLGRVGP